MGHYLSTTSIVAVFSECVEKLSGRVTDSYDDGRRVFLRSLLPFVEEARPTDRMQGGIALRATESDVCLHPYLFREVCRNGAIMAQTIYSWDVEFSDFASEDQLVNSLRDAIDICAQREVFSENMAAVRTSVDLEFDFVLYLQSMLQPHLNRAGSSSLMDMIFQRFTAERSRSHFSLMNAITSVARDTDDPERKWRLEELGGGISAGILPITPTNSSGRYFAQRKLTPA